LTVKVSSPFGEPVTGGKVTLSAPKTGASTQPSIATMTINVDGYASALVSANGIAGTYAVSGHSAGVSGVANWRLSNVLPSPPIIIVGPPPVINVPPVIVPPIVQQIQRVGYGNQLTTYLITFSEALNIASATHAANYSLLPVNAEGQPLPRAKVIPVRSAVYNAATHAVTITSSQRLNLSGYYRLTISDAVKSQNGVALDGAYRGKPGSNFVTVVHGFGPSTKSPVNAVLAGPLVSSRRASTGQAGRRLLR
jgi:Bacterial Ig-like domain